MKLTEKHIQETCSDFLALDGWRRVRMDMPQLRGMGVQEPGMPDDLYIRYEGYFTHFEYDAMKRMLPGVTELRSLCQVMWIEWKQPKGKTAQKQKDWKARERALGGLVVGAIEDFEPTIEGFAKWYEGSGLQRKALRIGTIRQNGIAEMGSRVSTSNTGRKGLSSSVHGK